MLLQTKIIVIDEATANVDLETDRIIQQTIREHFKVTVLMVAHRLATVIDSDRVMVMGAGRCLEYDHPFRLLAKDDNDTEITN